MMYHEYNDKAHVCVWRTKARGNTVLAFDLNSRNAEGRQKGLPFMPTGENHRNNREVCTIPDPLVTKVSVAVPAPWVSSGDVGYLYNFYRKAGTNESS